MAEEHELHAPEGRRLCVNNCGFFGSPATQNMCSKCYGDLTLKNSGDSTTPNLFSAATAPSTAASPSSSAAAVTQQTILVPEKAASPPPAVAGRCSCCRKKVGLTGFRCKCGITFCGTHRYPEKHGCTFDFKTVGRAEIAKANPVVKGQKLEKI